MPRRRDAFTLIELLVVVTIIAVLLALLAPAMDKAVYAAELTICGAQQHGIAVGALTYTVDFKQQYPYRKGVHISKPGTTYIYLSEMLSNPDTFGPGNVYLPQAGSDQYRADDRPLLEPYMSMKLMSDPMTPKIDLSLAANPNDSFVMSCYSLRFGWKFADTSPMSKRGRGWSFDGRDFRVLAGDRDEYTRADPGSMLGSHPDRIGSMATQIDPDGNTTGFALSRWYRYPAGSVQSRGLLDMNFAYDDGAVIRFDDVGTTEPNDPKSDERFYTVPRYSVVGQGNPDEPDTTGGNYGEWVSTPER